MATPTLLSITQNILSRLSSDEVNSISDTTESLQIANIVQNKFYDIVARGGLTLESQLFQLNPSGDPTKPIQMTLPTSIGSIEWIKYFDSSTHDSLQVSQFGAFSHGLNTNITTVPAWNTTSTTTNSVSIGIKTFVVASSNLPVVIGQGVTAVSGTANLIGVVVSYAGTSLNIQVNQIAGQGSFSSWTIFNSGTQSAVAGYKYVTLLPLDQFLDFVNRFSPTETNVNSYTFTEGGFNFNLYYKVNIQPSYCTVIANNFVLFDSFNNTLDTTLQASKTMCYGQVLPIFLMQDSYIPQLNDQQFSLLISESTALAFIELKQTPHPLANQEVKRQWAVAQKTKSISNKPSYFDQLANYGRVPRTGGYSSGGYGAYKWMRGGGGSP